MFGKGKENPLPPTLANIDLILSHLQLKKREVPQHQHQHQRSHAHRNASHEVDRGYVAWTFVVDVDFCFGAGEEKDE